MHYPFKAQRCQLVTLGHPAQRELLWRSGLSARVSECQKLEM